MVASIQGRIESGHDPLGVPWHMAGTVGHEFQPQLKMPLKNLSACLLPLLPAGLLLGQTLAIHAADRTDASPSQLAPPELQKSAHGVIIPVGDKFLDLEVCADNVIHVSCAQDTAYFKRPSLAVLPDRDVRCAWNSRIEAGKAVITTPKLQVRVALATGDISFFNSSNQLILAEAPGGRTWTPAIGNTRVRNRRTRSRCISMPAPMGRSRSMRTTA